MNMDTTSPDFSPFKMEGSTLVSLIDKRAQRVLIPEGVTQIADRAFYECTYLREIHFPEGVTSIGEKAFHFCIGLTAIHLPDSLCEIKKYAFSHCERLPQIQIPPNITHIEEGIFYHCLSLNGIHLPDTIVKIGVSAFFHCSSLSAIHLPDALQMVERNAFNSCASLHTVHFPESLQQIHHGAFSSCERLENLHGKLPPNLEVHEMAFVPHAYEYIHISLLKHLQQSIQTNYCISRWDFLESAEQEEVLSFIMTEPTLKEELLLGTNLSLIQKLLAQKEPLHFCLLQKYLNHSVEEGSTELTAIYLSYKNQHYSKEEILAYQERAYLLELCLELPDYIEFSQKWECNLKNQAVKILSYLGSSPTEIIPHTLADGHLVKYLHMAHYQYSEDAVLEELIIEADLLEFYFIDRRNLLKRLHFKGSMPENFSFSQCQNLEEFTISKLGESVLPNYAFHGLKKMKKITLPDDITRIGFHVFSHSQQLEQVHLPCQLKQIYAFAFSRCENLQEIHLPDSLERIDISAFASCISLRRLKIPDGIKVIPQNLCSYCKSLTEITLPSLVTHLDEQCFYHCESLKQIHLPSSIQVIGREVFRKCKSLSEIVLPPQVDSLEDALFFGCTSLRKISIGENVKKIGRAVFYECASLTEFPLPDSLIEIGKSAFYGCHSLESLYIPESVEHIGEKAFPMGCLIYGNVGTYVEHYCQERGILFHGIENDIS